MDRIIVTFNQQKAYDDRSLIFLNIYHPIIQACLKYFSAHIDKANRTFSYAIASDDILKSGSSYYLGIYRFITSRMVHGVNKNNETLIPFVFDVEKRELVHNQQIVDRLYSMSQENGVEYNPPSSMYSPDLIDDMRVLLSDGARTEKIAKQGELQRQAESERLHNEIQTREYYSIRINNVKQRIKDREDILDFYTPEDAERHNLERLIAMDKGLLETHIKELQDRLDSINENSQVVIDYEPSSLALINIK